MAISLGIYPIFRQTHLRSAQGVCSWLRTAMSAHARRLERLELRAVDPKTHFDYRALDVVNPKRFWLLFSSFENRVKSHK